MNNETEQIFLMNSAPSQSSAPSQIMGALAPSLNSQSNLDNVRDFSNVCRTCATITEFVMPIFSGDGLQNNLADKIKRHLPIQVRKTDELPLVVCYQCASTLLAWHELVKCSIQADAALRAKICSNQQKTNPPNVTIKSSPSVGDEAQSNIMAEFSGPQPQHYRACVYCASAHPLASYREHLVVAHADLLFHCEECDTFVDKKDFILHMSFHALQYTSNGIRRKKFKKKKEEIVSQNPSPVSPAPAPQCPPKTESKQLNTKKDQPPVVAKTKTSVPENEFSDHSDTDGFEPLPESVFEAIEDSQDSQHVEDNTTHTPENQPHSDESKQSTQPENNNLSNPAPCLENNNKFNNCSVVIKPININNCAQMNIGIKNSNVNSNLTLPANITPPKITDACSSDNHPTDERGKGNWKTRKCPLCPKECKASSSYYYHLKYVHKGSKDHECEVCGRKFNTRSCLTQHMAIHASQYEFECQQCQKQFKTKASLYIHEQTHSGKKSWSCSQCQMSFRWKTHLLRHMKRHAAEKGHVCDTCGRGFSVRSDLLRHARTHTAGDFACDKCGHKFAQLRYLKVHTSKQHSTNVRKVSK